MKYREIHRVAARSPLSQLTSLAKEAHEITRHQSRRLPGQPRHGGAHVSADSLEAAAQLFVNPASYTDETTLTAGLTLLRGQAPVIRVEHPKYRPFWAVTRYADIIDILRDHALWLNSPRSILQTAELDDSLDSMRDNGVGLRNLVHVDGEYHRALKAIAAEWFRPKVMRSLTSRIDQLAIQYVELMAQKGSECEFVAEVATAYPGYVILSLLGLPESDFPRLLRWSQELFGFEDEERRRGERSEDIVEVIADFVDYFGRVAAQRRAHPTDDLASAIANAQIDGAPLGDMEAISYYQVIAAAGHDKTKGVIAGGLLALIENPSQRSRFCGDKSVMSTAAEEMIRWSTPVKATMRTAARDTVVSGVRIRAGESVCLSYPSANRDPEAFAEPFQFDIGRVPNRHLGFGSGVHFCLGAALARMEVDSFFAELIPRLDSIGLAGEPEYLPTTFVGGLKRLPLNYTMR